MTINFQGGPGGPMWKHIPQGITEEPIIQDTPEPAPPPVDVPPEEVRPENPQKSVIESLKEFYTTKMNEFKETDFYKNVGETWDKASGVIVGGLSTVGNKIGQWIDTGASKIGIENFGLVKEFENCTWLSPVLGGVALGSASFIAYKGIKAAVLKLKSFKQSKESEKSLRV